MMCGLQGAGKTTHTAKLAKHFIKEGHRPLLAACDIYRPAAVDQLKIVGEKAGAPVFALPGEKPEAIAKKAVAHAKDYGNDIVILDTAGRLHVDGDLMAELQRIKENVQVDETLLVIDAMAGQDAVNVAKSFSESTGLDGVILTKLDGDTRGAFRACRYRQAHQIRGRGRKAGRPGGIPSQPHGQPHSGHGRRTDAD